MKRVERMKKIFFIALLALLTFTLIACTNSKLASNTIVDAELTDREESILSTTSNQSFVFDFNVGSEYKEATMWVEKYEFGELVDERIGYFTVNEVLEDGSIIFTTSQSNDAENQILFNMGINSSDGTSSSTASTTTTDIVSNKDSEWIVWGSISEEMDVTNEEMILASIGYSWDEGSTASFSPEFFADVERRSNALENYQVVYLLMCKFTE